MNQFSYDSAWKAVGGLSSPSKMPSYGWSVSAKRCKVGSKLRAIADSVCAKCYAMKGNYMFPAIQRCLERRLAAVQRSAFVPAMVYLLKCLDVKHFRWYDSGDIDSPATLRKIIDIATQLPEVKFWLPTKEYGVIGAYVKAGHVIPPNLCVRLSAYMVDESGPILLARRLGVTISEVSTGAYSCPSSKQGNRCLTCRACWDNGTFCVSYKRH